MAAIVRELAVIFAIRKIIILSQQTVNNQEETLLRPTSQFLTY